MATVTAEREMGIKRNDVTAKIDADVIRDAKAVAALKDISLAEYLSEVLRPVVQRDMDQEFAKRAKAPKR